MMGQTFLSLLAVSFALTTRSINRFVDSIDDVRNTDSLRSLAKSVSTTRATDTAHKLTAPQLREQLLQIREGNTLPLRDVRQIDRAFVRMNSEIEQCSDCISAFRC